MKLFKKLFHTTLTYKVYAILFWLKEYIKDYEYVSDSFYSEAFLKILHRYLNVEFKKDWIGRLYAVVNPHIDINGNFNFSNTIIELDADNTNDEAYVSNWLYRQMSMVQAVFRLESSNFFDYIGATVKHVGPINHDNYLITFDIVSRKELAIAFKSMIAQLTVYIIIGACCYFGWPYLKEILNF